MKDIIFEGLNNEQKEAVSSLDGPVLVIAGAGTGKTRVITSRIAHLILSNVEPSSILAVTFTNKAANEMKERVASIINKLSTIRDNDDLPYIKTFHSLGFNIIKENHKLVGVPKNFTVYDSSDQTSAIKNVLKDLGYDINSADVRKVKTIINKLKTESKSPDELRESNNPINRLAFKVFHKYEEHKHKDGALDFSDLLAKMFHIFEKHPEILEKYQNRWKYIHVDEYQDTSKLQFKIIKLLSEKHKNIFVVGDLDQTIYTWRGATTENILKFEQNFPGAKRIILKNNYRSTKNILDFADAIITKNVNRIEKEVIATRPGGEKIKLFSALSAKDEANWVSRNIKTLTESGEYSNNDICVLYRMNFQSRVLEESMMAHNIKYQVLGVKFFDRKEVKDIVAYISSALIETTGVNLKRILNTPKRGLGKVALLKILNGEIDSLTPKQKEAYKMFHGTLSDIKEYLNKAESVSDFVRFAIKRSGYEKMLQEDRVSGEEKLANLKELVSFSSRYNNLGKAEGVEKMLEDIYLMSDTDTDNNEDSVRLMTIHASKGLEFKVVFLVGLEDEIFPGNQDNKVDPEEERRLMYVAITRAKERLYCSYANSRIIYGDLQYHTPSTFITEVPEEIFEIDDSSMFAYNQGQYKNHKNHGGVKLGNGGLLGDEFFPTIT